MAPTDDRRTVRRAVTAAQTRRNRGLRRVRRVTSWVTATAAAGLVALGALYAHTDAAVAAPPPGGAGHAAVPSAGAGRHPASPRHHRTGHSPYRLTPAAPPSRGTGSPDTTSGAS